MAKASLREQNWPSNANRVRYYHTAVHKNITRDRFIRSVNPIVAEKMRAILEELKRKESGRG